jgi:hypothetical protein
MRMRARFVITQRLLRDMVGRAEVSSFTTYKAWPFTRELADLLAATEPHARAGLLQAILDGQRLIGYGECDAERDERAVSAEDVRIAGHFVNTALRLAMKERTAAKTA